MIDSLAVFIIVIVVWMLVTTLTDWQAVFYRKHIVYMRRMKDDLVGDRKRDVGGSVVSQYSVSQNTSKFPESTAEEPRMQKR